jgi:hypothetical protein
MQAYGVVEVRLHSFLTVAVYGATGQLFDPAVLLCGISPRVTIKWEAR